MAGQIYCKSCGKKNTFEIVKPAKCSCGHEFVKVLKTEEKAVTNNDFEDRVKQAVYEELAKQKKRGGLGQIDIEDDEIKETVVYNKPRPKIPSSWFKVVATKHMTLDQLSQQSESIKRQE